MSITYKELLEELMQTKIGGFGVEFARSNYDPAVLSICKGRLVMFGCVDPSDTPVPPLTSVVERVRVALKYIEPKNLLLAPDCGLMTISRELANAKESSTGGCGPGVAANALDVDSIFVSDLAWTA